ncbi:MAG: WxcM-like domain-containing protein [Acidobacteriota bacterium]|nr:WxcM-like domain-containing protein [Acidobacteriota bacterium]
MIDPVTFSQHEKALVESQSIGQGTRIGALAHVLARAVIGTDCNISDYTLIENDVLIGNRVTIKSGVQIWDGITIEDDVFIGPNATFGTDPLTAGESARTVIEHGASIGPNATISLGITIGERARVAAASLVTRSVPPLAIVAGNPASIVGYEGAAFHEQGPSTSPPSHASIASTQVRNVNLHRLPSAVDMRGQLSFAEIGKQIPFEIERFFLVYGVASKEVRGEHAHRELDQFLICVHGQCSVVADDGENRQEFLLDDPTVGLHVPPLVWAVQYKHTADAVLLVLASHPYDPDDYIRDYAEFARALKERSA